MKGRLWPIDVPFATVKGTDGQPLVRNGFVCERRTGDFQFKDGDGKPTRDRARVRYFEFTCPSNKEGGYCGVIRVGYIDKPEGPRTWAWDGNFETPTLNPSINCLDCWHGWMRAGDFQVC